MYFRRRVWYRFLTDEHRANPRPRGDFRRRCRRRDGSSVDGKAALFCRVRAGGERADWGARTVRDAARAPDFQAAVAELSRLQYENAVLAETVRQLQQDAPTIENVARAELGLIKPGEILVVVESPAASTRRPRHCRRHPALTKTAMREARP